MSSLKCCNVLSLTEQEVTTIFPTQLCTVASKMKDQVMVDEMGKQPRISVHGPRGKKNPQMGQDAPTKPDPLKKAKSGKQNKEEGFDSQSPNKWMIKVPVGLYQVTIKRKSHPV